MREVVSYQLSVVRKAKAIIFAVMALGMAGKAGAMVTDGTLLTNVASASFRAADNPVMQSPTYCSTANVIVYNPAVQLKKQSTPTMQCSGGTVTFCIYAVNVSPMSSAFNVIIEDILPGDSTSMGMAYVLGRSEWLPQAPAQTVVYGYRTYEISQKTLWPPTDPDGEPSEGVIGPYYIRWAVNVIGPKQSMMVCFKATVL